MRSVDSNLGFGSNSVFKTEKQSERERERREREREREGERKRERERSNALGLSSMKRELDVVYSFCQSGRSYLAKGDSLVF